MNGKRVIAVRHIDHTEFECPDCGNYMIVCDTTRNIFSRGEVSETGSEYLFCQKCGVEREFSQVEAYEKTLRGMLAKRMAQDPQVEF